MQKKVINKLNKAIGERKTTQLKAAKAVGVTSPTISRWRSFTNNANEEKLEELNKYLDTL